MPLVRKKRVENVLDYHLFNLGNDIIFKIIRQKPETMCKGIKTLKYSCENVGLLNGETMFVKSSAAPEIRFDGRQILIYVGGRHNIDETEFKTVVIACIPGQVQPLMASIDLALTEWANNLDKFVPETTG